MTTAQQCRRAGIAYLARREFAAAEQELARATRLDPGQAAAWLALGIARRELGRLAPAHDALARALVLDPAMPQASGQLGLVLQSLGRHPEAVERFAEEAARCPQVARNHNNLGMALNAVGRESDARQAFVRAVQVDPDYCQAHANLAASFQRHGDLAGAETAWRQVLRLAPDYAAALGQLGHILTTTWRLAQAEPLLARAVALAPDEPAPARTLAYVLGRLDRVAEARTVARAILQRRPDDLQANVTLRLALPVIYESAAALLLARGEFARGLDELVAQVPPLAADPAQVLSLAWENFHLAYQGGEDRALQEKYARWLATLGRRASPRHYEARPGRTRAPGERLRVGFLSSFFRDCTAGKYFASWITDLDRARFEVFAYYTGHVRDAFSQTIAAGAEHYRHVIDVVPRVADAVLADRLDVLVHPAVGMDTASYLLAGMSLAPVQCAGWGHPVTTGQTAIGFFLTCGDMEPEDAEAHYTEELVRLPGIGTRYARPGPASVKGRSELGLPVFGSLYLCPQSLFKIHPDNDALFARLLAADSQGTLVFFRDHDEPLTGRYRERLFRVLQDHGIDGSARTVFLGRVDHADYLRVNELCDAMIDTLHWSGGNTTLDALAAGLPIVTLPGRFMRGRQSLAMLRSAGLAELVARDEADYVRLAVRLATDRSWSELMQARIRGAADRIFDDPAPIAALESFLADFAAPPGA